MTFPHGKLRTGAEQQTALYAPVSNCRACGSDDLQSIIDFGMHSLPAWPLPKEPAPPKAPLEMAVCGSCGLLQLKHTVERDSLFREYWYRSGITASMRQALGDVAKAATTLAPLRQGDIVLDIGANDGTLLRMMPMDVAKVGFEPSDIADGSGNIIKDYFSADKFLAFTNGQQAKVITALAMFYDLEDPGAFLTEVKRCLAPDGLFVIQQNDADLMCERHTFDNVGHEHLCYYRLEDMALLLAEHKLAIEWSGYNDVNGGSHRILIRHRSAAEGKWPEKRSRNLKQFCGQINLACQKVREFAKWAWLQGYTVDVLGASTRGLTIMQTCGLDRAFIRAAIERDPNKVGREYGGTGIEIISEEQAAQDAPDYKLILPYFYITEIMEREKGYLEKGGKLVVPLPEPAIYSGQVWRKL